MENTNSQYDSFIGIDVAKRSLVIHGSADASTVEIANDPADLQGFLEPLKERNCLIICEATGGYEGALLQAAMHAGIAIHRADARKVKAFIRSFGRLGKSDAIDARALATYGAERANQLPLWEMRGEKRTLLQGLVMRRDDLIAQRTAETNRSKAPQASILRDTFEAVIAVLDATISDVEKRIKDLVESDGGMKRTVATLTTIPGIGHTTACNLLALMPELGTLSRRKIASLAGLAPHPRDSGDKKGYRSIRGGRPNVRRAIFMAAMAAKRTRSNLGQFATRLEQNGKKPIVIIAAIMRKIVTIANAKIRDQILEEQQS